LKSLVVSEPFVGSRCNPFPSIQRELSLERLVFGAIHVSRDDISDKLGLVVDSEASSCFVPRDDMVESLLLGILENFVELAGKRHSCPIFLSAYAVGRVG
jgi:hypothetical protein